MKKVFIHQFFPNCENSPGGSEKLVPAEGMNSAKVEGVGKLKKVISRSYLDCSATSLIRNSQAVICKITQFLRKPVLDYHTSLSANQSYPLYLSRQNHKRGRSQGLEGGGYKRGGQC